LLRSTTPKRAPATPVLSHHLPTDICPTDPDLALVIERWSDLPEAVRAGNLPMARATGVGGAEALVPMRPANAWSVGIASGHTSQHRAAPSSPESDFPVKSLRWHRSSHRRSSSGRRRPRASRSS
jgi:hypothetical protein